MNLPFIALIFLTTTATLFSEEPPSFRVYQVPSGIVTYTIQNDGPMIQKRGQKRRIFDRYGYRELVEEATVQTMNIMGETQREETHTKTLRVGTKVSQADLLKKRIVTMPAMGLNLFAKANGGDLTRTGEKMLQSMGAKKKGQKRVAGVLCDLWELPGITQCLYKGVTLEIVTEMPNLRQVERATEARFDLPVAEANFRLPDFPTTTPQIPPQMAEAFRDLSQEESSVEAPAPSSPQSQRKLPPALRTELQQHYQIMKEGYSCFENARSLSQAQACSDRLSNQLGESPDTLSQWDRTSKTQLLDTFKTLLHHMECAAKASTFGDLDRCQ